MPIPHHYHTTTAPQQYHYHSTTPMPCQYHTNTMLIPHHYHTILQVAGKNWFVANVSTNVETANPEAEIQPGLNLLGPIKQKFLQVLNRSF